MFSSVSWSHLMSTIDHFSVLVRIKLIFRSKWLASCSKVAGQFYIYTVFSILFNEMKRSETKRNETNWNELNWNELNWIEMKWIEMKWNKFYYRERSSIYTFLMTLTWQKCFHNSYVPIDNFLMWRDQFCHTSGDE